MDRKQKREVVAALIKAGRKDLAEQFVKASTVVTAGYTHYWRPPGKPAFSDDQWKKLVAGVKKIIAAARKKGIEIGGPMGNGGKVQYKGNMIALNGVGPNAHESFMLKRDLEDYEFCKTNEKPYDDVVVSILALAKKLAPELIFLSSDGGDSVFNNPPFKA